MVIIDYRGTDADSIVLADGMAVPFVRCVLSGASANLPMAASTEDLAWFDHVAALHEKIPLTVSPSAVDGVAARVSESVAIGSRMELGDVEDRSALGQAIHACLAADLVSTDCPLTMADVLAILQRMGVADAVDASAMHRQVGAVRTWLQSRWPDAKRVVALPVQQLMPGGQIYAGRADVLAFRCSAARRRRRAGGRAGLQAMAEPGAPSCAGSPG